MHLDVAELRDFYASPLGIMARRLVVKTIERIWPDLQGQTLLGLGYATPYLSIYSGKAERVLAFMPAKQGVMRWPPQRANAAALVHKTSLPLQIGSVDRVILVHALEVTTSPEALMEEIWRILTPSGKVLVIVPNRRGLWTRMDTTPFGQGQPFSRSQLSHLMQASLFSAKNWGEALYIPPIPAHLALRSAFALERIGASLGLPFAGVHILEAEKQLYRPCGVRSSRYSRGVAPVFIPSPSVQSSPSPPAHSSGP